MFLQIHHRLVTPSLYIWWGIIRSAIMEHRKSSLKCWGLGGVFQRTMLRAIAFSFWRSNLRFFLHYKNIRNSWKKTWKIQEIFENIKIISSSTSWHFDAFLSSWKDLIYILSGEGVGSGWNFRRTGWGLRSSRSCFLVNQLRHLKTGPPGGSLFCPFLYPEEGAWTIFFP